MSFKVYVGFPTSSFEGLVSHIKTAPAPYTPEYFTWSERVQNKADKVVDNERFKPFLERAKKIGCTLLGNKIAYHLEPNDFRDEGRQPTHGCLFVEFKKGFIPHNGIVGLLHFLLDVPGIQFGYACQYDESSHRHHVVKKWADPGLHAGASSIEFTIGVDFRHYVPGLYWTTIFEHSYLLKHNLSPNLLSDLAVESNDIHSKDGRIFHCYKFYDKPDKWQEYSNQLDEVCAEYPQIFSMRKILNEIAAIESEEELREIVAPYR